LSQSVESSAQGSIEAVEISAHIFGRCADPRDAMGSLRIRGSFLRILQGPVVYAWFRGDVPLYVGKCVYGIRRLTDLDHPALAVQEDDVVHFWPVPSKERAEIYEKQLIRRWRPTHNKMWNPNNKNWNKGFSGRYRKSISLRMAQEEITLNVRPERAPRFKSEIWRRLQGRPPHA
jgi:hypothetical protein